MCGRGAGDRDHTHQKHGPKSHCGESVASARIQSPQRVENAVGEEQHQGGEAAHERAEGEKESKERHTERPALMDHAGDKKCPDVPYVEIQC